MNIDHISEEYQQLHDKLTQDARTLNPKLDTARREKLFARASQPRESHMFPRLALAAVACIICILGYSFWPQPQIEDPLTTEDLAGLTELSYKRGRSGLLIRQRRRALASSTFRGSSSRKSNRMNFSKQDRSLRNRLESLKKELDRNSSAVNSES